ncbi:alpha/beta fold hydrolase [Paracoccus limosus]|uniref:Alpha/beta fold hydrolase n=2 Tax=Paracoccus limosus TaxID=913252 RepID=A0A844H432_9RHOB|nr:alpha/beta fold hydrolase [Paracoccus limosus]
MTAAVVIALIAAFSAFPAAAAETALTLDGGIAATLVTPDAPRPFPAVIMLHGLGSNRDEVGNLFLDAADALAERGIASLRFDFRGFGKSDGDTGAFTLERQNQDALTALEALAATPGVDAKRIGVMGFSFGAAAAIELAGAQPDRIGALVTWAPVGDYRADMLDSMGPAIFRRAARDGIVGIDLGWRTLALKQAFFDSLDRHDLPAALARYPGAFLTINGSDDPYLKYAPALLQAAAGQDKRALVIPGGDHMFNVYQPSRSSAAEVIGITADQFARTLAGPAYSPSK